MYLCFVCPSNIKCRIINSHISLTSPIPVTSCMAAHAPSHFLVISVIKANTHKVSWQHQSVWKWFNLHLSVSEIKHITIYITFTHSSLFTHDCDATFYSLSNNLMRSCGQFPVSSWSTYLRHSIKRVTTNPSGKQENVFIRQKSVRE